MSMKNINIIIGVLCIGSLLMFVTSCHEKFLEEEVHDFYTPDNFFTDAASAEAALTPCYNFWPNYVRPQYAFTLWELPGPGMAARYAADAWGLYGDSWIFTGSEFSLENAYNTVYYVINECNLVIQSVPELTFVEENPEGYDLKTRYVAEAKFLRAWYHFWAVRTWGDIVLRTKFSKSIDELYQAATPAAEVYDTIISDLKFAEQYLPEVNEYASGDLSRACKGAAQALLAKVYLTRGYMTYKQEDDFQNAANYCQKVINKGIHQLAASPYDLILYYKDAASQDYAATNYEVIFECNYDNDQTQSDIAILMAPRSYGGWGIYSVEASLYLDWEENEPRKDAYLHRYVLTKSGDTIWYDYNNYDAQYGTGTPYITKYTEYNPYNTVRTRNTSNVRFIRYADVLLMYAEALCEVNNGIAGASDPGLEAINKVRRRAWEKPVDVADPSIDLSSSLSKTEYRKAIYMERTKELIGELHGYFDAIRFWDIAKSIIITSSQHEKPFGIKYGGGPYYEINDLDDHDKLLPFPSSALDRNPILNQNDGY